MGEDRRAVEVVVEPLIVRPSQWAARERTPRASHSRVAPLRCKYSVESRITCCCGDGPRDGTVIGNEVRLVHAEMRSRVALGEVEHLEVNRYSTNTATHLERIDSFTNEVTKQLRPRTLLPVRRVPNAGLPGSVVTAGPEGGVCASSNRYFVAPWCQ